MIPSTASDPIVIRDNRGLRKSRMNSDVNELTDRLMIHKSKEKERKEKGGRVHRRGSIKDDLREGGVDIFNQVSGNKIACKQKGVSSRQVMRKQRSRRFAPFENA